MPKAREKIRGLVAVTVIVLVCSYLVFKSSDDPATNRLGIDDQGAANEVMGGSDELTIDNASRSSSAAQQNPSLDGHNKDPHHIPDYSPILARGGARASFQLVDAKGQVLSSKSWVTVRLFRAFGDQWIELSDAWRFEESGSTLVVDGKASAGMESGSYEIEILAGPYGAKRHSFSLSRNQHLRSTIDFDHWRKVLALTFVDQFDVPLNRLGFRPRISTTPEALTSKIRSTRPSPVLSTGQAPLQPKNLTKPQQRRAKEPRNHAYLLDQGRWHLPVYVGAKNKIHLDFEPNAHGRKPFHFESDFTDETMFDNKFVVTLATKHRSDLESLPAANPDDFGQASEISAPPLLRASKTRKRTHAAFLDIELIGLSPTLAAYTLATRVDWNYRNQVRSHKIVESQEQEKGSPDRFFPDMLPLVVLQCSSIGVTLTGAGTQYGHGFRFDHAMAVGNQDQNKGKLVIPAPTRGVVMRIVDSTGKPMPWAEASILSIDDDRQAQNLRAQLDEHKEQIEKLTKREGESQDDFLNRQIKATLPFIRGDADRRHLRRFGTWYDPNQSQSADIDGFLFFPHLKLRPHASYVLYVWGKSQDPHTPNLRLLFRPQPTLTDLGAIKIPQSK